MKFYHGTSLKRWEAIQKEGILWSYNIYEDEHGVPYKSYRYTYLTPKLEIAEGYGEVVLEVEYDPKGIGVEDEDGEVYDNYGFDPPEGQICWQFSVFNPIPIANVKRI